MIRCAHHYEGRCTNDAVPFNRPSAGVCMRCDHYDGPERTPELIEATIGFKPTEPPPNPADCAHRVKPLRMIPAPVCGGQVPVHECALHGECVTRNGARAKGWQPPDGVRVCETCRDRLSRM